MPSDIDWVDPSRRIHCRPVFPYYFLDESGFLSNFSVSSARLYDTSLLDAILARQSVCRVCSIIRPGFDNRLGDVSAKTDDFGEELFWNDALWIAWGQDDIVGRHEYGNWRVLGEELCEREVYVE